MSCCRRPLFVFLGAALALCGCKQNPFLRNPVVMQGQLREMEQQQTTLAQRSRDLESRAQTLDKDNQELESLLAQARQKTQVVEDQLAAVQDQLRSSSTQLAQARLDRESTEKKSQSLLASLERRSEATITANNSLSPALPVIQLPGVEVRRDGDVMRVELPADKLFDPGGGRLRAGAEALLGAAAAEIAQNYPRQIIGIEGHTSTDPTGAAPAAAHTLTLAQASTVYDYLTGRGQLAPAQLFVAAHGSNHPVVSNGTPSGQARNRRVELVIYPEKAPGR